MTTCNVTCPISVLNSTLDHLCAHHPSLCHLQNSTEFQHMSIIAPKNFTESITPAEERCAVRVLQNLNIFDETNCSAMTLDRCNISCEPIYIPEASAYAVNPRVMYFWILMVMAYIFMGPASSLGDTIILSMIPNCEAFGRQRLYGSVGWGLSSILAGQLVDTFSKGSDGKMNFTPAFFILLSFGVADFIVASRLKDNKVAKPKHLFRGVGRLFLEAETALLTVAVFFVGFISGIMWTFLIVYLVSLGANPLLIGLTIGVDCFLGEMPFMFVAEWFLKKLGHGHSMTLVAAVFGVRFVLYSFIDNPWFVLPIETTQGICFGVFFTALATYSTVVAPPSAQATMQGILQAIFEGLGAGTGSFFGGLIYQTLGGKSMWLVMGATSCSFAILHGLILLIIQKRKTPKTPLPPSQADAIKEDVKETEVLRMLPAQLSNGHGGTELLQ